MAAILLPAILSCDQGAATRTAAGIETDTLPDGRVQVRNMGRGLWPDGAGWQVAEAVRIGSRDQDGPQNFGDIRSFIVDVLGRIWVLDGQASALRVFDSEGRHVRTIGRAGAGPGEFRQPVHVAVAPDHNIWVMDPGNARIAVFDTAGNYVRSIRAAGPVVLPWPGGFDQSGHYYSPVVRFRPAFSLKLARFDSAYTPVDTLDIPVDPIERDRFRIVVGGVERADEPVPFQGGLTWRLARTGRIWALLTDQYRLFELDARGDTLRTVTMRFTPVAVTAQERTDALAGLREFIAQGGMVDPAQFPSHKPPVSSFFVDDEGHVWARRATSGHAGDVRFDVFNAAGQYLGAVAVPFNLQMYPSPITRSGLLYGVVVDAMDVQLPGTRDHH